MGIFSLFNKKDRQQATPADKSASRTKRAPASSRPDDSKTSESLQPIKRDTQAARETALKIDAIESEMSSEFVKPSTNSPSHTLATPKNTAGQPPVASSPSSVRSDSSLQKTQAPLKKEELPTLDFTQGSVTEAAVTAGFSSSAQITAKEIITPSTEIIIIEEAAILFANNQTEIVEHVLQTAISENQLGNSTLTAWWMLFDLYQITEKQQAFENLSIEYASKFETSPPTWRAAQGQPLPVQPSSATPTVSFFGKLDSNSAKQIERIQKLAENHRSLRLEFLRITEVDPAGCSLLLNILKKLQKSSHELVLVGASELALKVKGILEVGRREETEDSWLLLLEILRLLNHEKEFEESSIDYCITFEVSPPAFIPPLNKVTMATEAEPQPIDTTAGTFLMPTVIEGRIDQLIAAISTYSNEHTPAIINCSQLNRIDFNTAGLLLTSLAPLCRDGKSLEFHHVNHLVTALFNVIGLKDIARILPRKH